MQLRPYQREAVEAVYHHLRHRDDNPCVVIPTAGGKTPVMATICRDAVQTWNGRVVILAHVKELLEQAAEKLVAFAPDLPVGIFSAGLKRRDLEYSVTIAGIQSIYQRACELGSVDLIIVDEAHLITPSGDGMYRLFLADASIVNPSLRVIGLTATPYRMKTGMICTPPPEGVLNEICYEVGVRELIVQGYLCPLRTKAGCTKADFEELHVRGGEFIAGEVENLMDTDVLVPAACAEIVEHTQDRDSVLIFACGVQHGQHIVRVLRERHGVECGFVEGNTPSAERTRLLDRFRSGDLKYLANINVLTTGFDATNIDCIAMLRPTFSPGLYYQMVGRGFRLHPGKDDCLVLDFGGNVLRHGPVDQIRISEPNTSGGGEAPAKECPECHALIHAAYATCPECGNEFPPRQRDGHEATAGTAPVLSGEVHDTEHDVRNTYFNVHTKRDADPDHPRSMRVEYQVGFNEFVSEWVCIEHPRGSYPRTKAEQWWCRRSNDPVPEIAEDAVDVCERGGICDTSRITVRHGGERYDRIVGHELGQLPPRLDGADEREWGDVAVCTIPDDEIPF